MACLARLLCSSMAIAGLVMLASCGGVHTPVTSVAGLDAGSGPEGRYYARECWFEVPSPRRLDCGELAVPENWEKQDAPAIHLPVVIFRSPTRGSSKEPIVMLSGGPGGRANIQQPDQIIIWLNLFQYARWTHDRDVIVLAQRGTNWTDSNLSCPEIEAGSAHLLGQELIRKYMIDCGRQLASRYDLAGYNSLQSAHDVVALAMWMGLEQWSIYGVSYGTRFALTIMNRNPAGLRSVVLDSVLPPSVDHLADRSPAMVEEALAGVFAACRADPMCFAHYAHPDDLLRAALHRLERQPITMRVGGTVLRIDQAALLAALSKMLAESAYGMIPGLLQAFAMYSEDVFWQAVEDAMRSGRERDDIVIGAFMAIACNDGAHRAQTAGKAASPVTVDLLGLPDVAGCQDWPSFPAEPGSTRTVVSDIPVLLLAGALDPTTPPADAELAAATLSRSHVFIVPAVGHGVLWSHPCASEIVRAFLEAPSVRPDVTCLPSPVDFSMSLQVRAANLALEMRVPEAERLLEQVLAHRKRILAPGHQSIAETLGLLGAVYYEQGRLAPAENALKRALAILAKAYGPESAEAGSTAGRLAMVYHDQGRSLDADAMYRRALRVLEREYGQGHPEVISYRRRQGELRSRPQNDQL